MPRTFFFFKCQKIPIQNHGLWFLVHFFLGTFLFGGLSIFRNSKKNPGFSCPAHPRWSWCLGKPSFWTCAMRPEKSTWYTRKNQEMSHEKGPLTAVKRWKDCLPNHPSWGAMWVFGPWGEYHVKLTQGFWTKPHVKVNPPIFWRVILNWCLLSWLFLLEVCLFWLLEALSFTDFRGVRKSFDSQPWSVIVRSRNQESDQRSSQLAWNYPSGTKSIGRWQVW